MSIEESLTPFLSEESLIMGLPWFFWVFVTLPIQLAIFALGMGCLHLTYNEPNFLLDAFFDLFDYRCNSLKSKILRFVSKIVSIPILVCGSVFVYLCGFAGGALAFLVIVPPFPIFFYILCQSPSI